MSEDVLVGLPAADLLLAVERVLEDRSPFAGEASLVVDEVLRLRDGGQLSESLARDLGMLIYQRSMHSQHSGDFQLTAPMWRLEDQIDHHRRSSFPEAQIDPVHVHARVAGIAAGTLAPLPAPELGQGDHPDLITAIARCVAGDVEPGWDSLRFEATMMGNVTTCLTYVDRSGKEERSSPPFAVADQLDELKDALARPGRGSWISLTMLLTSTGGLTVEYNYDQDTNFGPGVTANDFALELRLFPRDEALIPVWWRERITHGDD